LTEHRGFIDIGRQDLAANALSPFGKSSDAGEQLARAALAEELVREKQVRVQAGEELAVRALPGGG